MTDLIRRRISAARAALILDHPFFGALALKLEPTESTCTKTMATDGRSLFYDPAFVASIDDAMLIAVLAHEVMHPAMQHHTRREGRDPDRWNQACDYAINPLLVESGFKVGKDWLINPSYKGLSAEQIFTQLTPPPHPQSGNSPPQSSGGPQGKAPGKPGQPAPGSKDRQPGEVLDAPEPSQDAAEWQVAVKQATQAATMMGRMPAGMAREIAEATAPKVDWRSLLRRFVQQSATSDYSWKRPNPRYVQGGLYLPALRSESMPPMAIAVDTSGSIGAEQLAAFEAEAQAIAEEMQPEAVHVIYCDADISSIEVFERGERVKLKAQGGGGTDFRPPFVHIDREGLTPACAIYLTDGAGRYPKHAPDYPVLWAMTGKTVAPWGETVEIQE